MKLSNKITINSLKEIAKKIGVAGNKEADILSGIEALIKDTTTLESLKHEGTKYVSFTKELDKTGIVSNYRNLPNGAVIANLIDASEDGCLNSKHNDLLFNVESNEDLEAINYATKFNLKNTAKIMVIDDEKDYALLFALCGTFFDEDGKRLAEELEATDSNVTVSNFINYEEASKIFDAIVFTRNAVTELGRVNYSCNLHGVDYETIVVLNKKMICNVVVEDITDLNETLMIGVTKVRNNIKHKKVIKPQYEVRKVSINDLTWDAGLNSYVLAENFDMSKKTVKMSENRLFRKFGTSIVTDDVTNKYADKFIVFNAVNKESTDNKSNEIFVKTIMSCGFIDLTPNPITGMTFDEELENYGDTAEVRSKRLYNVTLQSTSQARQGKYYFSCLDRDLVRSTVSYKACFSSRIVIAKMEARIALATSSSTSVGNDFTVKVIPDRTHTKKRIYFKLKDDGSNKVMMCTSNVTDSKPHGDGVDVTLTPTDGQGTIEILPSARVANRLGLISKRELIYFETYYTGLNEMKCYSQAVVDPGLEDHVNFKIDISKKLMKIFNKIPTAFQTRMGGDKGLLVMFPHSEYTYVDESNGTRRFYTQDIVVCESMHKYEVPIEEISNVELEVCNWNKAKKDNVFMSYQFLQSLNISREDIKLLAKSTLDKITEDVMKDSNVAMKFLGMIYNIGGLNVNENMILVSKLTKILAEDSTMINDRKVQKDLKGLLTKFLSDLSFGRIPVRGSYNYITVDPRFMLGCDESVCLQSGQNYFNGVTGLYAGFRSPMIHSNEIVRLMMQECNYLWFMKDIIVINPFDNTLPSMGGASL